MKTKLCALLASALLAGCANITAYSKPSEYTSGLLLQANGGDFVITKIIADGGKCQLRLAAGAHIQPDGSSLERHGVIYLPVQQDCRIPAGKLSYELENGYSSFDFLSECEQPQSLEIWTNHGHFVFKQLPVASKEQIQAAKLKPAALEPEPKILSDEELTAKAMTCQPY